MNLIVLMRVAGALVPFNNRDDGPRSSHRRSEMRIDYQVVFVAPFLGPLLS